MSKELLPMAVGDGTASQSGEIQSGAFMTFYLSGAVTTGFIEIQTSYDKFSEPGSWRSLVEDGTAKQLDSNNTSLRLRGPLRVRAVRRGPDAIGVTASNWYGDGDI